MLERLRNLCRPRASAPPIESVTFLHHTEAFAGPFHVSSREPAASCMRLKDGRLHVIRRGDFPDLLEGPEYILASRALADVLQKLCGESIKVVPVEVVNVSTGETLARDRFDVVPNEEITPEMLHTVDATGSRAWHFRKSDLFVTKQVVLELQKAGFSSLQFDPGFSRFSGGVASAG